MKRNRITTALKLKAASSKGASMLMCLLVFFLAAFSGTVALTMAASNAGRYTHTTDEQQAYLSVASAAKIVLGRLEGVRVFFRTRVLENPNDNNVDVSFNVPVDLQDPDEPLPVEKSGLFLDDPRFEQNLLIRSLSSTSGASQKEYQIVSFRLTLNDTPGAGSVYVELDMSSASLVFRLWAENGSHREYQTTIIVSSKFDQLNNYQSHIDKTSGEQDYYYRILRFYPETATYTVERSVEPEATPDEG